MEGFLIFTSIRYDLVLLKAPDLGFANLGWNQTPSPFYMLDLHRDRMLRAAIYWGWEAAITTISGKDGLQNFKEYLQSITTEAGDGPCRLMITLAADGTLGHQISSLPATSVNNLLPRRLPCPNPGGLSQTSEGIPSRDLIYDIYLDSQKTTKSEFTHFKTTFRDIYNEARNRAQIIPGDKKEVLLVNDDGHIMEGSISTPYFWRDGRWVTPPISKQFGSMEGSGGNDGTTRRWALERSLATEQVVLADSLVDGEECWISNGLRGFIYGNVKLH
ncbi:aminotransferase [Hypomontagnella monticulosa]|nr:aminotransferase [Hypomontagnella monticulosa]